LFARAGSKARIRHADALRHALSELPASSLDCPPETAAMLDSFGVHTIGGCLRLPRSGLAQRLGRSFLDDLDRALGRLPALPLPFVPPPTFNATLPLPAPVEDSATLLFSGKRLLAELCGFMAATGNGALCLNFSFSHEDHTDTRVIFELVSASRDPDHLTAVLRERLARLDLPRPVTTISLAVENFSPLPADNLSFLPDARDHAESAARLIEKLRARLGERAVCGLTALEDYRPEFAWQPCEPGKSTASLMTAAAFLRPLWLLRFPCRLRETALSPCWDGPLSLLAGPERIETGWWDESRIARDYFVARNPAQSLLWIYRERDAAGGWYLHGIFG
jgi:protein ImuB